MRIAVVQADDGTTNLPSVLGVIDRDRNSDPASGLGLLLREAHALLKALQAVVLDHQINQFLRAARRCRSCGKQLARKDTKFLIYRTAFGKGRLPSPRLYSRCANCGAKTDSAGNLQPAGSSASGEATPAMEVAAMPVCERHVVQAREDLPAGCVSRRSDASVLERQGDSPSDRQSTRGRDSAGDVGHRR